MVCAPCPGGDGQFSAFDRCDGEDACSDGSDEAGCMYPCASGEMVMIQLYCDGKPDCGDGSDCMPVTRVSDMRASRLPNRASAVASSAAFA